MKSASKAIFCFCQQFTVFCSCSLENVQFHNNNKKTSFTQLAIISLEIKDKA